MKMILPDLKTDEKFLFWPLEGELSDKECSEKEVAVSVHIPSMQDSRGIGDMVIRR
jgi:hypothetical protein